MLTVLYPISMYSEPQRIAGYHTFICLTKAARLLSFSD